MKIKFPRSEFDKDRVRRNYLKRRHANRSRAPQVKKAKVEQAENNILESANHFAQAIAAAVAGQQPLSAQTAQALVKLKLDQDSIHQRLDILCRTVVEHGRDMQLRSKTFDGLCAIVGEHDSHIRSMLELVPTHEAFLLDQFNGDYDEFSNPNAPETTIDSKYPWIDDPNNPSMVAYCDKRDFIQDWLDTIEEDTHPIEPVQLPDPAAATAAAAAAAVPTASSIGPTENAITPLSELSSSMVSDNPLWKPPVSNLKPIPDARSNITDLYQQEKTQRLQGRHWEDLFKDLFDVTLSQQQSQPLSSTVTSAEQPPPGFALFQSDPPSPIGAPYLIQRPFAPRDQQMQNQQQQRNGIIPDPRQQLPQQQPYNHLPSAPQQQYNLPPAHTQPMIVTIAGQARFPPPGQQQQQQQQRKSFMQAMPPFQSPRNHGFTPVPQQQNQHEHPGISREQARAQQLLLVQRYGNPASQFMTPEQAQQQHLAQQQQQRQAQQQAQRQREQHDA